MGRPASEQSLHRKVARDIRRAIETGQLAPGSRLPNEIRLGEQYAVSRTTIRQALVMLTEDRLIDRIPGRHGIFVSAASQQMRYLHMVTMFGHKWIGPYDAAIMSQTEQHARRLGWRVCIHHAADLNEVTQMIAEVNNDPFSIGGTLEGRFTSQEVSDLVRGSPLPWVVLSDLVETVRSDPVLDQVICDAFSSIQLAARTLIDGGCRNIALFIFHQEMVWNQDCISAFRSVLDAAEIPANKQQIFDLAAMRQTQYPVTLEENTQGNFAAIRLVLEHWKQTDQWPDGIIMPESDMKEFERCIRQDAQAKDRLKNMHVTLTASEETVEISGRYYLPWHTTWILASVAQMVATAVSMIRERRINPTEPRRKYIREVRAVTDPTPSPTPAPHDAGNVSAMMV